MTSPTRNIMAIAWGWTAALGALDAAWMARIGVTAPATQLLLDLFYAALLLGVWAVYRFARPAPILAEIAQAAAFLILFTLAIAIASYLSFTLRRPFRDDAFAAFDAALRFETLGHLAFLVAHPTFARVINLCYLSSMAQIVVVVLALGATQRFDRLRAYLALFALTASAVILASALWPTLGTYPYFHVPDALLPAFVNPRMGWEHVPHILALRDGTMTRIPLDDMRGLVAFPSFHTALAVITMWALFDNRWLAAPILAVNALLILATPSNGSHYLADVIAGAAIAFVALALVTGLERSPRLAPYGAPSPSPL